MKSDSECNDDDISGLARTKHRSDINRNRNAMSVASPSRVSKAQHDDTSSNLNKPKQQQRKTAYPKVVS